MFSWVESLLQIQSSTIIRTATYITRLSQLGFFLGRQSLYQIRRLLRISNCISHKLYKHIQSQPNSKKVNLLFCEYYQKLHGNIQVHRSNQNQGKKKNKQSSFHLCVCCSKDNLLSSCLMQKLINLPLMLPMNVIIIDSNQYESNQYAFLSKKFDTAVLLVNNKITSTLFVPHLKRPS